MSETPTGPSRVLNQVLGGYWWLRGLLQERSVPLLVSLLVLLAIGPKLTERFERLAAFELLLTMVMVSSIRQLSVSRSQMLIGVLLALTMAACLWLRKLI